MENHPAIDVDAIIILEVFNKTTNKTPKSVIETCKRRLRYCDAVAGKGGER